MHLTESETNPVHLIQLLAGPVGIYLIGNFFSEIVATAGRISIRFCYSSTKADSLSRSCDGGVKKHRNAVVARGIAGRSWVLQCARRSFDATMPSTSRRAAAI